MDIVQHAKYLEEENSPMYKDTLPQAQKWFRQGTRAQSLQNDE